MTELEFCSTCGQLSMSGIWDGSAPLATGGDWLIRECQTPGCFHKTIENVRMNLQVGYGYEMTPYQAEVEKRFGVGRRKSSPSRG